MQVGDRVVWKGANPDGWPGNGRARILDYNPEARYFHGHSRGTNTEPSKGPGVLILIDQGNVSDPNQRKHDVWVPPNELRPDQEPLT